MSRIQLALNVDDLEAATAFYSKLFGTGATKTRPGYANFAIADPPLKLVLLENRGAGGTLNHLGVEVGSVDEVDAEQTRLPAVGLVSTQERDSTCCYAKQTKFWVENTPGGERWEVYTVLAETPRPSSPTPPPRPPPPAARPARPPHRPAAPLLRRRRRRPPTAARSAPSRPAAAEPPTSKHSAPHAPHPATCCGRP